MHDSGEQLPSGWAWAKLGEILPIRYGQGLVKADREAGSIPVFGSSGIIGHHSHSITAGATLIVGRKGSVGSVFFSPEPCWPIDTVYFAEETEDLYLQFFLHLLAYLRLDQLDKSTAVPGLSRDDYNRVLVQVPPLPEQRRMVAAIEQQFTRLDAGVMALKRAQARLKRYRAAVLKAAVEGELTAEWRAAHPATETGAELLQRILAERRVKWEADLRAKGKDPAKARYVEPVGPDIETLPTVPDSWCWASLGALSFRIGDVDHKMPKAVTDGIAYISTKDFTDEDHIDFDNAKRISTVDYSSLKRKIHPEIGDLLLSRYGTIGEIRRVSTDIKFHASYSIAIIKMLSIPVLGFYLSHALKSAPSQASMRSYVRASSQPDLGLEYIRLLPIPLPPLAEQSEIVAEVERRLSVVTALEASIAANLRRAERLRQSILREAFAGRLVAQDPTDEPASILLDRIRTGRTARPPSRGRRSGVQQLELADAVAAGS